MNVSFQWRGDFQCDCMFSWNKYIFIGNNPVSPFSTGVAVVGKVQKVKPPPPVRRTDDDKILCAAFTKSLEDAEKSIKGRESGLMQVGSTYQLLS